MSEIDTYENNNRQDHKEMWDALNGKVSWKVFWGFIVVMLAAAGWFIAALSSTNAATTSSQVNIASIQSDISWIKSALQANGVVPRQAGFLASSTPLAQE